MTGVRLKPQPGGVQCEFEGAATLVRLTLISATQAINQQRQHDQSDSDVQPILL